MRDVSGTDGLVEARASVIEGVGLFAVREFEPGDAICRLEFEREITHASPLRPEAGERIEHCAHPDGKVMLVAHPQRHMNHSCDPNAYYDWEDGGAVTRARRAIGAGEEISVDYLINNPGGHSWPCHCGASRCRGMTGVSFFDLPLDIQREYAPLLAPWFRERFAHRLIDLLGAHTASDDEGER